MSGHPNTEPQIVSALNLLHGPDGVAEVRIFGTGKGTISGYYDAEHFDKAARDVLAWDGKAEAVYITLNPIPRDLMARAANRLELLREAHDQRR
jgi:hypothetical protein